MEHRSAGEVPSYDRQTVVLHWATAVLVVLQWTGAQLIDRFPKGPLRVDARSMHITLGCLLALVIVARITWRSTRGRRLPPTDRGLRRILAGMVHTGLYVLLVSTVSLGLLNVWVRGDSLFNLASVPKLIVAGVNMRGVVGNAHALAANLILALAGVHAAAALWHQYVRRDRLMKRMSFGS